MIKRSHAKNIKDFILSPQEHKNVLIVDGVRQTGKTTAVRQALDESKRNFLEINLETEKIIRTAIDKTNDFSEFELLLKREYNFSAGENRVLFIDEANESFRLAHYIRQMKEDWKNQTVILTGSMMYRLFRDKSIRIPVGRFDRLTIRPFSFGEFLLANEQTSSSLTKYGLAERISNASQIAHGGETDHRLLLDLLDHYLTCGGLPDVSIVYLASSGAESPKKQIFQYLESLKDDFIKVFSEEYGNLFDRAVASVANILGQPYKKTALIQNNDKLANNVLTILENWKFIIKIEQKTHRPSRSNSLYPKRYLFDVGVAKNKREMGIPSIRILETLNMAQREPLGGLMEQLLCCELLPRFPDLCGFRTPTYEIDFVIKTENESIPVECKAALKANKNQYKGPDLYHRHYHNKKAVIVSLAPFSIVPRSGYTIYHVPVYATSCLPELLLLE